MTTAAELLRKLQEIVLDGQGDRPVYYDTELDDDGLWSVSDVVVNDTPHERKDDPDGIPIEDSEIVVLY